MQLPLFLLRRGQPGLKPRGLFDLFDSDSEEEDASRASGGADAPSSGGGTPQEVETPRFADEPAQESSLDYARRQAQLFLWEIATLGTGGLTRNPLTGEIYATKFGKRLGGRMSEIAQQVPFGPGRAGGPSRPTGPAAVGALPQSGSGFLFGGPQAKTVENEVYRLPPDDDRGEDEDCEEQLREEEAACWHNWGSVFGKRHHSYTGCKERAKIRADLCRRGIAERPPRWSDADVDGWSPPPVPKG